MKCGDTAFNHQNVPSPVAQLVIASLQLVQPLEVHRDTLHKLTFTPLTLKPCLLQMALNSTLVHFCILPLSIARNTASSTSYANSKREAGLEVVEGWAGEL